MNEQRVNSVISHRKYPIEMKYLIKINEEVVKDILEDYSENSVNEKIKSSLKTAILLDVKAYLQARLS